MKRLKILLIVFVCLLNTSPAVSQSITLFTLGDSLTTGDGDEGSGGGYPVRLASKLQASYPGTTLTNHAISGDTTQDLINKQLTGAVADLNAAPVENLKIALVWIGSNDLFGLYAGDVCTEYYTDLAFCEKHEMEISTGNVNTILSELKATGATLYIACLDDQTKRPLIMNPEIRAEIFPGITNEEVPKMSAQIAYYNDQVKAHAASNGATTVDFYNTTIFENTATLSDDGNHPNSAGYDAIARIWYQSITGSTQQSSTMTPPTTQSTKALETPEEIAGAPVKFSITDRVIGFETDFPAYSAPIDIIFFCSIHPGSSIASLRTTP